MTRQVLEMTSYEDVEGERTTCHDLSFTFRCEAAFILNDILHLLEEHSTAKGRHFLECTTHAGLSTSVRILMRVIRWKGSSRKEEKGRRWHLGDSCRRAITPAKLELLCLWEKMTHKAVRPYTKMYSRNDRLCFFIQGAVCRFRFYVKRAACYSL